MWRKHVTAAYMTGHCTDAVLGGEYLAGPEKFGNLANLENQIPREYRESLFPNPPLCNPLGVHSFSPFYLHLPRVFYPHPPISRGLLMHTYIIW